MAFAQKSSSSFAIAYMDLDDFKPINDSYGHEAGDEYLRDVGKRLSTVLKGSDVIARYGADEYVFLLSPVRRNNELEFISEKMFNAFEKPF